jgi:hypothetical protein
MSWEDRTHHFNIILPSILSSSKYAFPFGSPKSYMKCHISCACYIPRLQVNILNWSLDTVEYTNRFRPFLPNPKLASVF